MLFNITPLLVMRIFRLNMSLRRSTSSSPMADLEAIRSLLAGSFPQVSRLLLAEVLSRRDEPAVIEGFSIKIEGKSAEELLQAREVGDLSDTSFKKNASKRTSTPDMPFDVLDDFFLKEEKGSVKCDWPGSFGSINYG